MRIESNNYSIAEIRDMLESKNLLVNHDYQRGSRLWPVGARSYFIDTILTGFPFPKLYFYEFLVSREQRIRREIVDGQQRITSIIDFINNKYAVTSVSENYKGKKFSDLTEDEQVAFLSYSVQVDVIRNAEKADILEMFRRMNAYTLPLNSAEKRHSGYQGVFKWAISRLSTKSTVKIVEFGIFSERQIVRMADAELFTELALVLERGLVSTSSKMLSDLYEKYDEQFDSEEEYINIISEFLDYLSTHFGELKNTTLSKPYVMHSLFAAAILNRQGLANQNSIPDLRDIQPIGRFCSDPQAALIALRSLALAHEEKDVDGDLRKYVRSCLKGTNRLPQRVTRTEYLANALRGNLMNG